YYSRKELSFIIDKEGHTATTASGPLGAMLLAIQDYYCEDITDLQSFMSNFKRSFPAEDVAFWLKEVLLKYYEPGVFACSNSINENLKTAYLIDYALDVLVKNRVDGQELLDDHLPRVSTEELSNPEFLTIYNRIRSGFGLQPVEADGKQEQVLADMPSILNGLTLYFEKDQPQNAASNLINLTRSYFNKRDAYLKAIDVQDAADNRMVKVVGDFFERLDGDAISDLDIGLEELLTYLQNNKKVRLELKAFASPAGSAASNKRLTERRIQVVENYMQDYKDGTLLLYLQSGQLELVENARG
ncbi:MAG: hypothetical protein AAFO07_12185, partial [Bacteroidota bacterium]